MSKESVEQGLAVLQQHFTAKLVEAKLNLDVYLANPVGVGEHSDIAAELIKRLEEMEQASGCLETLNRYYLSNLHGEPEDVDKE